MKKISKLIALTLSLTLAACGTTTAANDATKNQSTPAEVKTMKIAFLPNENTTDGEKSTEFLIAELQAALGDGYKVEGIICDDYSAVAEAVLTGTAQIAWESGATFASAHMEDEAVIPLFTYGEDKDGDNKGDLESAVYKAYIATNKKNEADFAGKTLDEQYEQLLHQSFSFVSATSTSGRLVPTTSLFLKFGPSGKGLIQSKSQVFEMNDSEGGLFSEIQFGGNHQGSVQLIVEGKAYAGAFCCQYGDDFMDDLYIIDVADVPNGPLWVNSNYLTEDEMKTIKDHFVNLTPDNCVDGFFGADGFFWEADNPEINRFIEQPDDFYDFLFEMYAD